jgi:hypothetical protein
MSGYDKQYTVAENLFGSPYKEFEDFVRNHALKGGKALPGLMPRKLAWRKCLRQLKLEA